MTQGGMPCTRQSVLEFKTRDGVRLRDVRTNQDLGCIITMSSRRLREVDDPQTGRPMADSRQMSDNEVVHIIELPQWLRVDRLGDDEAWRLLYNVCQRKGAK